MYLKNLYHHNKLLFALIILFICGQLFVILIWGIVITPFYNYGMYSEKMQVHNKYEAFEVELNGKRLRGQDYSPQQWDKIILPLQFYRNINKSNALYRTDIKRILTKMGISTNEKNFISSCNYPQFEDWYKSYLSNVTSEQVTSLKLYSRLYKFSSNSLKPADSIVPLALLCR